jgi:uncharacterized membrane protein
MRALLALRATLVFTGTLPWICAAFQMRTPWFIYLYHTLCHQISERTLSVWGAPMLVCSRCAGLYLGIALGALLPLSGWALAHARKLLVIALFLTVLDVTSQDLGLHDPHHGARLATGWALGFFASAFMVGAILTEQQRSTLSQRRRERPLPSAFFRRS